MTTTQSLRTQTTTRRDRLSQIAAILAALPFAAAIPLLTALLAAAGVSGPVAVVALRLVSRLPHEPIPEGPAGTITARRELDYRAAFLLNAALRIQAAATAGQSLTSATALEQRFEAQHVAAVTHRALAARQVDRTAKVYGDTLGWHLGQRKTHTPVCEAASGKNFSATRRPLAGFPGTSHAMCGCHAGPPFPNAGTVDDATRVLIAQGLD